MCVDFKIVSKSHIIHLADVILMYPHGFICSSSAVTSGYCAAAGSDADCALEMAV